MASAVEKRTSLIKRAWQSSLFLSCFYSAGRGFRLEVFDISVPASRLTKKSSAAPQIFHSLQSKFACSEFAFFFYAHRIAEIFFQS